MNSFFRFGTVRSTEGFIPYLEGTGWNGRVVSPLEQVETVPVTDYPIEGVEVNRPVEPQVIERVEAELFGQDFGEPVLVANPELPPCWK